MFTFTSSFKYGVLNSYHHPTSTWNTHSTLIEQCFKLTESVDFWSLYGDNSWWTLQQCNRLRDEYIYTLVAAFIKMGLLFINQRPILVKYLSHPLGPFIKPQSRTQVKKAGMLHIDIFISSSGFCCSTRGRLSDAALFQSVTCYQLWASFLFHLRHPNRKEEPPTQSGSRPEQSLVGADCHVPKVTSWPKKHIPQFSGGRGKPPGRGASLQCGPARCHADTVFLHSNPAAFSHIFSTGQPHTSVLLAQTSMTISNTTTFGG